MMRLFKKKLGLSWAAFFLVYVLALLAPILANDKPLWVSYQDRYYFPILKAYPETTFGGVFETEAVYKDPAVKALIETQGYMVMPPIAFSERTIDKSGTPSPMPPSRTHWLGTDDTGRDVAARVLYGLRVSLLFGVGLGLCGFLLGSIIGAVQGYYAGWVDLLGQRLTEVLSGLPQLFIMLILVSVFTPSVWLLFFVMLLFSWLATASVVRASVLAVRKLEYVEAGFATGLSDGRILFFYILPNALTPAVSQLPFLICVNITALTTLDYLGYGLPIGAASLGELIAQGRNNLDAPWLALSGFGVLTLVLSLLIFMSDGLKFWTFFKKSL